MGKDCSVETETHLICGGRVSVFHFHFKKSELLIRRQNSAPSPGSTRLQTCFLEDLCGGHLQTQIQLVLRSGLVHHDKKMN